MCVYSMVIDHFQPLFPEIKPLEINPYDPDPLPLNPSPLSTFLSPQYELAELRKLIDEFKECLEAAKKLDKLMKQPDCEDPEKAKLLDRVAELEKMLEAEKKKHKRKASKSKGKK